MVFSSQILGRLRLPTRSKGLAGPAIALALLAALSGCGQKGPLYMPVLPQARAPEPAPTSTLPKPPPADTTSPAPLAPASAAR